MVESPPTRAVSVILIFALLGPLLAMAVALAEVLFKGLVVPGDMSVAITLVVIGLNPWGLLQPLAILALPMGLTGWLSVMAETRLNRAGVLALCTLTGALFTLLSTPLLDASPSLSVGMAGGFAGLTCAMATQVRARLGMRR